MMKGFWMTSIAVSIISCALVLLLSTFPCLAIDDEVRQLGTYDTSIPPKCTYEHLKTLKGHLIDLDGTIYNREGLIDSAKSYHSFLEGTGVPYVYLSNGFKSQECLQDKFTKLDYADVPLTKIWADGHVWTAALSLSSYLLDKHSSVPVSIWVITTTSPCGDTYDSSYKVLQSHVDSCRKNGGCNDWEVRMDLKDYEVDDWAKAALTKRRKVYVVLAIEALPLDKFGTETTHPLFALVTDPKWGKERKAYEDFYSLARQMTRILRNGGIFLSGAPDVLDAQKPVDEYSELDPHWPSIGAYTQLFLSAADFREGTLKRAQQFVSTGKGGIQGKEYMMDKGFGLLQKLDGKLADEDKSYIAMIGDNLGTDILAGDSAGYFTILVLTGGHQLADIASWKVRPTCYVDKVGDIVNIIKGKIGAGESVQDWVQRLERIRKGGAMDIGSGCRKLNVGVGMLAAATAAVVLSLLV